MTWAAFLAVAAIIVLAGTYLARYGDVIAEKSGMGRTWIGLVLVASTTSLPELFTGLSAAVQRLPDLAVGDVLGSCMFNLLILSMMDAVGGRVPLSARTQQGHALSVGFGLLLISAVGFGLLVQPKLPAIGWMGWATPVIITIYLAAMRMSFVYERRRHATQAEQVVEALHGAVSLKSALIRYSLAGIVVVAAALALPGLGARLAEETGLGQALVGTVLIALTTSLPEVVVSLTAVRLGAVELAIGNVLGSNLFNILILALDDIAFVDGPILASSHPSHLAAAFAVVAMNSLFLSGLTYQALKKQLVLAWDTAGILAVYVAALGTLYLLRG